MLDGTEAIRACSGAATALANFRDENRLFEKVARRTMLQCVALLIAAEGIKVINNQQPIGVGV
ncbi:hypothetical protein Cenrod_2043 [Candidatus Symbiobacter mobilis CR]|uniref:Uncharacterized protein n=1 Tax=Candidatus Symbiobacter mobilis CR TaxID=946483 RepID=U5ND64_9BURK|nr:hypothetical protein Cenrod_2043 [Candidatus Symbiobacter mobilis CR]